MSELTVRLFGPQAAMVGRSSVTLPLEGPAITCGRLRETLARVEPALAASLPASRFAVNHEYADDEQTVSEADEVALVGMIGGG